MAVAVAVVALVGYKDGNGVGFWFFDCREGLRINFELERDGFWRGRCCCSE